MELLSTAAEDNAVVEAMVTVEVVRAPGRDAIGLHNRSYATRVK